MTASFNKLVSLNVEIYDNDQEEKSTDKSYFAEVNQLRKYIDQIMDRNNERDVLFEELQDDIQSITEQIAKFTVRSNIFYSRDKFLGQLKWNVNFCS